MATNGYDLGALRGTFPAWSFFRSDAGTFYATRSGVTLSDEALVRGLRQTISADDLATLVALLDEQNGLR
ncbi:hypothetical protein HII36_33045 [Nonomuraea sp. NN258]|uniref:hypothetical protein n=1 Tax=Nonomuraea antri TaxID=2730852 RepID=UPI001567F2B6|nr:hypothetical protein [Nonomuraea antri]NRQ36627.1 hypothetical protein [Nonomuraea antri]